MRIRPTVAEVRLDHLRHNMRKLKSLLEPGVQWIPMVKANAYGHGMVEVSRALEKENIESFGVSLIEEGIELRESGFKGEILIFGSFESHGELLEQYSLTPILSSFHQLDALESAQVGPINVHVKINTGMNRLGFHTDQLESLRGLLKASSRYNVTGVLTHIHSGDDALSPTGYTLQQLQLFTQEAPHFNADPRSWHVWSTTSLLLRDQMKKRLGQAWDPRWDLMGARPGLALYGWSTNPEMREDLRPVMTFKSQIVKVNPMKVGDVAGYGATFTAKKSSRIGVVPVGYADGYHRILSNKASVLVNGERAPVVGVVSMDYILVDLTELPSGHDIGAEVILFGESLKGVRMEAGEVAKHAGSIAWEMMTSVSGRVPREYKT